MPILIKNAFQIEGIRKSCQLSAMTLEYLDSFIEPGITTEYLNILAEHFIRDHGGIPAPLGYKGFPKSICTSVNNVVCHGVPNNLVLKTGDILNIDVSTILNGFYGDSCMMFALEPISEDARNIIRIAKECMHLGINEVGPGKYLGDIGQVVSDHAEKNNYSVVYNYCGHGVGLALHEEPVVNHVAKKGTGPIMKAGMVFTVEPMINQYTPEIMIQSDGWTATTIDGGLSAQFEHTILVTPDGFEILTRNNL